MNLGVIVLSCTSEGYEVNGPVVCKTLTGSVFYLHWAYRLGRGRLSLTGPKIKPEPVCVQWQTCWHQSRESPPVAMLRDRACKNSEDQILNQSTINHCMAQTHTSTLAFSGFLLALHCPGSRRLPEPHCVAFCLVIVSPLLQENETEFLEFNQNA